MNPVEKILGKGLRFDISKNKSKIIPGFSFDSNLSRQENQKRYNQALWENMNQEQRDNEAIRKKAEELRRKYKNSGMSDAQQYIIIRQELIQFIENKNKRRIGVFSEDQINVLNDI